MTTRGAPATVSDTVRVPVATGVEIEGNLDVPARAKGLVLFAHGSGSGRFSPRNRFVAEILRDAGLGTLLVDLLTEDEEREDAVTRALRFDMDLLRDRLVATVDWLGQDARTQDLNIGIFGSSTGGGGALMAAAERPDAVGAVVSRGGRPDLAGDALPRVEASTLLIVGGLDAPVIELNEGAYATLRCEKEMTIVEGATHLFEEPGKLEEVARLAAEWFAGHLEA